MRRRFRSICTASRSAKARGCRRRSWVWRRKWPPREICVECEGPFAGKPRSYRWSHSPVGARLAREGVRQCTNVSNPNS
ncbi:MAG: hypothetical protein C0411_24840 [Pseudomonas sp.]|nr:hypothetical protein [Pseudomonas sp.]TWS09448.1 hypothetical protein FJD35_16095 [Pseudomonas mandelii]